MINYADYQYYIETYKGSLSNSLFNSLISKASREIDKAVNREIKEVDLITYPIIKYVACELVEYSNNNKDSGYTSVSIDGVSKTVKSSDETRNAKRNILNGLPHELTRFL